MQRVPAAKVHMHACTQGRNRVLIRVVVSPFHRSVSSTMKTLTFSGTTLVI